MLKSIEINGFQHIRKRLSSIDCLHTHTYLIRVVWFTLHSVINITQSAVLRLMKIKQNEFTTHFVFLNSFSFVYSESKSKGVS